MKARCNNPLTKNYHSYGGRGIFVDASLSTFEGFISVLGESPEGTSLDRINNDGPYSKDNVRWATKNTQMRNKSNNRFLAFNGKSQTIADWSKDTGISIATIWARLKYGFTVEDALTKKIISPNESGANGARKRWGIK